LLELLLPVPIAAFIPAALYRFIGRWEIVRSDRCTTGNSRQVSIADLATLTFLAAVAIATHLDYRESINWDRMFAGLELAMMWALATFTFVVTTVSLSMSFLLMPHPTRRRVAVSCVIIIASIAVMFGLLAFESKSLIGSFGNVISYSMPCLLVVVTSLRLVRRLGYRLVKYGSNRPHPFPRS